jgi:hypothetical protein
MFTTALLHKGNHDSMMKLDGKIDTEIGHGVPSVFEVRGQGDYKCCHRSK